MSAEVAPGRVGSMAARIADYVTRLSAADVPTAAEDVVRRAVLDTVGVALCGYFEHCAQVARETVAMSSDQAASVWGAGGLRAAPADAAWLNAMAGHALDFDDYSDASFSHPSVVLLPATVAAGQAVGASGADVVRALVAGYEVMSAIGLSMGEPHYGLGFHATGTLGALGAAVAAAAVLGLDAAAVIRAVGIVCSLASGLRANVGTDVKPLHAANAAAQGVRAAQLAARGFTSSDSALDGRTGFIALLGGDLDAVSAGIDRLGAGRIGEYLTAAPPVLKLYPSCGMTHAAVTSALELRERLGGQVAEIDHVIVRVPPQSAWPLKYHDPHTGLEAKFCMEYVVAAALVDGTVTVTQFRDDAIHRPEVRALMARIRLRPDSGYERVVERGEGYPMALEITVAGQVVKREVLAAPGTAGNPVSDAQVMDKFLASVPPLAHDRSVETLAAQLTDITAEVDLSALFCIELDRAAARQRS